MDMATIMRGLHHSIALEIEGQREGDRLLRDGVQGELVMGLTAEEKAVSLDRSVSVNASGEEDVMTGFTRKSPRQGTSDPKDRDPQEGTS